MFLEASQYRDQSTAFQEHLMRFIIVKIFVIKSSYRYPVALKKNDMPMSKVLRIEDHFHFRVQTTIRASDHLVYFLC